MMAINSQPESDSSDADVSSLIEELSADQFTEWYLERQYARNIRDGKPYFNTPSDEPAADRYSPSQLLQCHRKLFYDDYNAPAETQPPRGIFWTGTRFEEDIATAFLENEVLGDTTYLRNSIWVNYDIESSSGALQIKGVTDPVIVDSDAVPILPTEIKTRSSLENLSEPNPAHRAQLHAYMEGLSREYDVDIRTGVLIYGSRKTLEIKRFQVDFDEEFWQESVLDWASEHTEYRLDESLPPASPEAEWECEFCDYRERCGKGDRHESDVGSSGLLTRYTGYPRERLREYLEANPHGKLTPSLAFEYRDLADAFDVYDWVCAECGLEVAWDAVDWNGDVTAPPQCSQCLAEGTASLLRGPRPSVQASGGGSDAE
jgi:CRISPR-associated exonuclease Cas4